MEYTQKYIRTFVMYSVLSTYCIHLLPGKKYNNLASFAVGLGYVCIILDFIQGLLILW